MKKLLPCASLLILAPFLASSLQDKTPSQPPQAAGLEARVAKLEEELAAQKQKNEETRRLLEQTVAYLGGRAKGAQTLLGVLDQAEELGFTAGINFQSREALLAGWRAYWGETEKGLPKLPEPPKEPGATGAPATKAKASAAPARGSHE